MLALRIVLCLPLACAPALAGEGPSAPLPVSAEADAGESRSRGSPASSGPLVPLPETPPPLVTDGRRGLAETLDVPLPDAPPEAAVRVSPAEAFPPPAWPDLPAIAAVPPPPPPALPGIAVSPPPPFPWLPAIAVIPDAPGVAAPRALDPATVAASLERARRDGRIGKAEAEAIAGHYAARDHRALWTSPRGWTAAGERLRAALAASGAHGLDPARYRTTGGFHGREEGIAPALAAADVSLSVAAVRYARELRVGRVEPRRIHPLITPRLDPPDAGAVLSALAATDDPDTALQLQAPPHLGYHLLRARLAEAMAERDASGPIAIPSGAAIRAGQRDARVPLVRLRLGLPFGGGDVYDRDLSRAVAEEQGRLGLSRSGVFDEATRAALSRGPQERAIADILANMELWRFVPRDLGNDHIMVNAPSFRVEVIENGRLAFAERAIVGKDETQTPFFSGEMDHIVVNPSWYVPPGILERDKRYTDPAWAAARGYEIRQRGKVVTVRVPPSSTNALGKVKFMFPNSHAVYLHDTNARGLFNAPGRALSNGCVRIENPMRLAAHLFAADGWTRERFERLAGGGERPMRLKEKMPVHLVYLTLAPDAEGRLQAFPDIYGHVARLGRLLAAD
jgi:murein L,D-transpeptidase YcbB/YkuD